MVLLNCDVGQGILFAGYKRVALQVIASPEEARLITTKPEEILAKQAQVRDNDNKETRNIEQPPTQSPEQHQEPSPQPSSEEGTPPPPAPS